MLFQVDLYGGSGMAVDIEPVRHRWPEREELDRLSLPVCLAALTLRSTATSLVPRVRHLLMRTAAAIVGPTPPPEEGSWTEAVAGRRMVPEASPGQPRIVARLLEGRGGMRVKVRGEPPTSLALASCTAAVAGVALDETAADLQLAAALALEGVLVWFRRRESHGATLQQAASHGFAYAHDRMVDADRVPPEALRRAAGRAETTS
ncbi:MAG: hypothetical protein AB7I08_07725 [Thermoleophilia bacterium]